MKFGVRKSLYSTFAVILLSLFLTPMTSFGDPLSCYFFYNPKAPQQFIQNANLSDLARIQGEWFEIVVPTQNGNRTSFEYKLVSDWKHVEESFEGININDRGFAKAKLDEYVKGFRNITRHFSTIARIYGASMKTRIKDIQSLRNKIIDRAKDYTLEGKIFTFERLDDFIGVRLMLEPDSELLVPGNPQSPDVRRRFRNQLGFGNDQAIEKIEFKGGIEDQQKERFYRAVHVTVRMPDGIPVEVQLMSKSTAIWHQWDHPKVYKAKTGNPGERAKLKYYSTFWIRLINTLEDNRGAFEQAHEIWALLELYGFPVQPRPMRLGPGWFMDLDSSIANWLALPASDRFLGRESALSQSAQRQLFRHLLDSRNFHISK
tara:strand:+ start:62817 stop:63938 length:1122 start_codon:yes stop_codon:yes gene_type:complete